MKAHKHLTQTQRLYLLTVDTSTKAFARLDREEANGGRRSWWTDRLFYWYYRFHYALLARLAAYDAFFREVQP